MAKAIFSTTLRRTVFIEEVTRMANKSLFASLTSRLPRANAVNEAGVGFRQGTDGLGCTGSQYGSAGTAYELEHFAATRCLGNKCDG